ncbi:hypothetical protein EI94DRAFT_1724134 [Lactarius quietus]|nr:hypothetical protein EI94DRAFT_1724134 [Lactarius quietus]
MKAFDTTMYTLYIYSTMPWLTILKRLSFDYLLLRGGWGIFSVRSLESAGSFDILQGLLSRRTSYEQYTDNPKKGIFGRHYFAARGLGVKPCSTAGKGQGKARSTGEALK